MIHHITNNVVTNFTANITLCMGAAPVMAPAIDESAEMVGFAGALLLNIGTLDPPQIESMLAAGRRANEVSVPVLLDPVGAGATALRTESARRIMREIDVAVVRGNTGEVLTLAGEEGGVRGVDSTASGADRAETFRKLAVDLGAVVGVTGEEDLVTDGTRTVRLTNGHPLMGTVTGTGCGASTAVACFLAASEDPLLAAAAGLACYGIAGEVAAEVASGPGTFVPAFLDALAALDQSMVLSRCRLSE
ncbi:hydroxyethylthiazole kinase [Candidatus Fermentibacteria bacterium]|nr:hydroxyethylthiazole kinase [Candidatus Fermentibacteria bacterium]